ncbi:MAG: hypothetical protein DDT23_00824 [candidate division WS2 bacterium]|nr:hypothetical protein [Candidatus Lithacetigena glycinireducens]
MWVTSPHLAQGIELGHAWGFGYRTVAFVWDKMVHNPGQYTLSYCELCLVFKQGRTFYADKPQLFIVEYERNKTPNNKIEATGIKLDGFSALVAPAPHSNR